MNINQPGSAPTTIVRIADMTGANANVPSTYKSKIVAPNIVNGVNTLMQEMINEANVKYIFRYDFTLGEDITIPVNCVLDFDGGSISNGVINLSSNVTLTSKEKTILKQIKINGIGTASSIISNICLNNIIIDNENVPSVSNLHLDYCHNILLTNVSIKNYDSITSGGMLTPPSEDDYLNIAPAVIRNCENITMINISVIDCLYEAFSIQLSKNVLIDNMFTDDRNVLSNGAWTSLTVERCENLKVINSTFYHKYNSNNSGSTINFTGKHLVMDNCFVYGGCGIDCGDEYGNTYGLEAYDIEDIIISNTYIKSSKSGIYSNSSTSRQKDIRVENCFIDCYYEKNGIIYETTSFDLCNIKGFISINNKISSTKLIRVIASQNNSNEQLYDDLGNINILNTIYENSLSLGYEICSIYCKLTDLGIKNSIISTTNSVWIHGGGEIDVFNLIDNTINANTGFGYEYTIKRTTIKNNVFNPSIRTNFTIITNSIGELFLQDNIFNDYRIKISPKYNNSIKPGCDKLKIVSNNIFISNEDTSYYPIIELDNGDNPGSSIQNLIFFDNTVNTQYARLRIYANLKDIDSSNKIYNNNFNLDLSMFSDEKAFKVHIYNSYNYTLDTLNISKGTFANKPTLSNIGFRYFCTDKQTPEQAAIDPNLLGIEIIYKGSGVWVDALGRIVS